MGWSSVKKLMIALLRLINRSTYALMDLGVAVTQIDVVAPSAGSEQLRTFYERATRTI